MKQILALILILTFYQQSYTQQSVNTTLTNPSMTNLYYSNVTRQYYTGGSNLRIGQCDLSGNNTQNGPLFNYVLIVFDLDQQLGGKINTLNSGSVTVQIDGSYGYDGAKWQAGIITTDVSNSSAQAKINAIKSMSYSEATDVPGSQLPTINLTLTTSKIVNNKIIVGVRRDNAGLRFVSSCTVTINGTILRRATLNVTYNQGTGNIVAYSGSYNAPIAPAQITAYETNTIQIAPLSPAIPSYQLVYNENQAPLNKSYWQKFDQSHNITTQKLYPASNSFALLKSEDGWTYEAQMKKLCNVTLSSYDGIKINGTNYSSPQTRQIVEGNTITAEITQSSYQSNYLKYKFDHWSTGSTSPSITLTVNNTQTVSAIYKGYATTKNVHFINIIPGQPICLDWDAHDNAGVTQYKVWRYPKYDATTCIATLGSSVTSFTDYEYVYSTGSPDATVMFYSVTAYYSPDQTWGEQVWINTSGEESDRSILTTENTATITEAAEQDIIPEYKLSNSPNPFNPTTQIYYSLPETEQVTIKVFNMLGKEVTELVNAVQRKGEHVVTFNADNLSSGVYIYNIQTPHYTASKKMILMK